MKKMHAKHDVSLPKQKNRVFLLNFPSTCKTLLNSSINISLIKKCFNLIQKELFPTLINASDNLWGPSDDFEKTDVSEDASLHPSKMGVLVFSTLECLSASQKSKRFTD